MVLAGAGWVLWVAFQDSAPRGELSTFGQFALAALTAVLVLWDLVARWFAPATPVNVDEIADELATAIRRQWDQVALDRGLMQPAPLPIRWRRSQEAIAGPPSTATSSRDGQAGFDPLPGLERVTSGMLRSGGRTALHRVYGGVASGRVVIVGRSGSGKSSAAVLLLLDALRYREQASPDDRARIPVPVVFTLADWDPSTSFGDWLAGKLCELSMFSGSQGAVRARQLIEDRRIAVFLDGLDEIPADMQPQVLRSLSSQCTLRLVLLTRTEEMVQAAQHNPLIGAVALELLPLRPNDVAHYLLSPLTAPPPQAWVRLAAALTRTSVIAAALNRPLTVSLVRDAYTPDAPVDELLDTQKFARPQDITDHLVDHAVAAAYTARPGQPPPRWNSSTARRTLAFVAKKLDSHNSRELAWWTIINWVPLPARLLITVLVATVAAAVVLTVVGVGISFGAPHWSETLEVPVEAMVASYNYGVPVGVTAVSAWRLIGMSAPVRLGPLRWRRALGRLPVRSALLVAVVTVAVSMAHAASWGGLSSLRAATGSLLSSLIEGYVLGLAFLFAVALTERLVAPNDTVSPVRAWNGDMTATVIAGAITFAVLMLPEFFVGFGLGWGISAGLALWLIMSAASRSLVAMVYLWAKFGLPLRLMRFLDDARHRHLLRTVGPVYQFRHSTLQDRLVTDPA